MISAWVLYITEHGEVRFAQLQGKSFASTAPEDWGLHSEDSIFLVLQSASFLTAFVDGKPQVS